MVFYSKKSWGLGLLIFIPLSSAAVGTLVNENYQAAILPVVILALFTWLWFGTRYYVTEDKLKVWAGFIPFPGIPIEKIIKIKPTSSFISAPACSLDRILVQYGSSDYIIISPKRKKEFVEAIVKLNTEVVVTGI